MPPSKLSWPKPRRLPLSPTRRVPPSKILAFAACLEIGTGLLLTIAPSIVVKLLLGTGPLGAAAPLGRVAGIALLALGVACWPNPRPAETSESAFRAMLTYNLLIAVYLACLGTTGQAHGWLVWPAVVLHFVVAALLHKARREEHRASR
jgi:hypothetical protein